MTSISPAFPAHAVDIITTSVSTKTVMSFFIGVGSFQMV
jgi:hypothetical protein